MSSMPDNVTPADSRYVPFVQQPYCCVPASLHMVMYRRSMPLVAQEELGYHLGLVVPPNDGHWYWNPRISAKRPPAGYGTQIQRAEYSPDAAFERLGVPLRMITRLIDHFDSSDQVSS